MKHIVVKDIKSETKVFKFIYIQDFFFITLAPPVFCSILPFLDL